MIFVAIILFIFGSLINFLFSKDILLNQAVILVLSVISYFFIKKISFYTYSSYWKIFYIISIIFLVSTYFFSEIRGSHRWLIISGITIQPSELVKPFIILSWGCYIAEITNATFKKFFTFCILSAIPVILIFKQPDLGNSIIYFCVFLLYLYLSPFSLRFFLTVIILLISVIPIFWFTLADYQKLRIMTFIFPHQDIQGAGYNAFQSLISIGSGSLFGKGFVASTQTDLQFLPEYHTDFIFASTIERIGFVGGAVLYLLYFILLILIFKKTRTGVPAFYYYAFGIFGILLFHIAIHIGMNMQLLPITGITLPFISLGGSSVLSLFIALGILKSYKEDRDEKIALH